MDACAGALSASVRRSLAKATAVRARSLPLPYLAVEEQQHEDEHEGEHEEGVREPERFGARAPSLCQSASAQTSLVKMQRRARSEEARCEIFPPAPIGFT
eukprot:6178294-Pleurochrysis_carterae.AAC.2